MAGTTNRAPFLCPPRSILFKNMSEAALRQQDGLRNTVRIGVTQESKSFVSECFRVYGVGSRV